MPTLGSELRRKRPEADPLTALQRAVAEREAARDDRRSERGASLGRPPRRRWRLEPVELAAAGRVSYPPGDRYAARWPKPAPAVSRPSRRPPPPPAAAAAAARGGGGGDRAALAREREAAAAAREARVGAAKSAAMAQTAAAARRRESEERRRGAAAAGGAYSLEALATARRGSRVALAAASPPRPERSPVGRPPRGDAGGDERPAAGAAGAWEAVVTPEGDTYYYDRISGASQWAAPPALNRDFRECCYDAERRELAWAAPPGASVVDYAAAAAHAGGAPPPRWVRCYYDAVSGETCWIPPAADGAAAHLVDEDAGAIPEEIDGVSASAEAPSTTACWYDPAAEKVFWERGECGDPDGALPCVYDAASQRIDWATDLPPPPPPDAGDRAAAAAAASERPADESRRRAARKQHAGLSDKMARVTSAGGPYPALALVTSVPGQSHGARAPRPLVQAEQKGGGGGGIEPGHWH